VRRAIQKICVSKEYKEKKQFKSRKPATLLVYFQTAAVGPVVCCCRFNNIVVIKKMSRKDREREEEAQSLFARKPENQKQRRPGAHSNLITVYYCTKVSLLFFFNACILRYYLAKPLTSFSFSLNAVFPCLKMREHLCLRYCNVFNPFYNLPWRRVKEKSHLFHSIRRSGRDWESNPGHLRGKQRH
jgi:hypothetical protein